MLVLRQPTVALLGCLSTWLAGCSDAAPASGGTAANAGSATAGTGTANGGTTNAGGTNGGTATAGMTNGGAGGGTSGAGAASGGTAGAGGANGGSAGQGGTATGGSGPVGGAASGGGSSGGSGGTGGGSSGSFVVSSPDQADGAKFGTAFTCAAMNGTFGAGVNPELDWTGVPANTMSFAITFIDTKLGEASAMGQHWATWDIPAAAKKLPKGTTTFSGDLQGAKQTNKYLAPCPSGDDTYAFTVYALSTPTLSVTGAEGSGISNSAGVAKVLAALKTATVLGTAKLTGTSGPKGL